MANILTRRSFFKGGLLSSLGLAFGSMLNIPPFLQQAMAEGNIGLSGKKVLFIFLRGANDGLNSVIPIQDPEYLRPGVRSTIAIPKHPGTSYDQTTRVADEVANNYPSAINLRTGFAAMHPALNNLVPLYNAGQLALIHRVGYPKQSRSHFDSQKYWENGVPSSRDLSEGIFYRAMEESGLIDKQLFTAVSVQQKLPVLLRGRKHLINLSDTSRIDLAGVNPDSRRKHLNALGNAFGAPFAAKDNRELSYELGRQFLKTVDEFERLDFRSNEIYDTDGTTHLFPIDAASNQRGVSQNSYGFFRNLKSAAQMLANTSTIVAGTEMGGYDTHVSQGAATGAHADLLRSVGWAMYAMKQYFTSKNMWNDMVVVTLSEFGRTTIENGSNGTDHAEASVMFVAGGGIKGGVYGCHPNDTSVPWVPGPADQGNGVFGSMYAKESRYLKRAVDYRSVLGEIIRDHLGATQPQLNRIIPGYANESLEHLMSGGTVTRSSKIDTVDTKIFGELGLI